ncbi:hypothetical protein F0562_010211 [Nyssa sinensis]|uniref:Uncharacterized protein n=1 Tax=Nyssa sinensis TaxID=561372 RepID=A0A5J5A1D1_9ASTE|nr:hypothetical protein F0562_010211 [Nyssa sinensis]
MASKDSVAIFSFPNITSFVSVKLDGTNYLNWTTQFIPILRSHDLLGIVDGSEPCPVQFVTDDKDKPTSVVTTDYLVWQKKDQFILAWINATLTEKVLSTVYGRTSSRQVWNTLSNRFAPHSRSRISHLKRQLQTLNQSNKTCTDYLLTAKNWSDQLAAVGKLVDEEDLISYVVAASSFVVKDLQTNKVLFQGPSEAGLYPVPFQQFQFNKMKAASSFTALLGVTAPV